MAEDTFMGNVPVLPVGQIIEDISRAYTGVVKAGVPLKTFPSVMMWGPPGVGKSQAVREIGSRLEKETGKRVNVTDVRLLLFNPIDLRGIPTANADKTLAVWLRPWIFDMDESEDVINILFLDEITAAPQSVQAAAYQITLDRVVGEHKLPENCIVMAAGNRTTDKSVSYKMPKPLANRLLHIEVEGSFEGWREWAVRKGINPKVVGFLSFRPDLLMKFDPASEDVAFATPRSWEMVSNILNTVDDSPENAASMISGLVGTGTALEFITWVNVYDELPSVEDIFSGKAANMPTRTDAMYALCSAMTFYASEHRNEMKKIENSITFARKMPPDFSVMLLKDYMYIEEGYKEKLMKLPEFARWLGDKGQFL